MKLLILDDEEVRVDWVRDAFPKAEVHWVQTPTQFAKEYQEGYGTWSLILLDHDLGLPNATGRDAVQYITNKDRDRVIVWSLNFERAIGMVETLTKQGISARSLPFCYKDVIDPTLGMSIREYLHVIEYWENGLDELEESQRLSAEAQGLQDSEA